MMGAYFLSRTLVPACSAYWLKSHGGAGHGNGHGHGAHASKSEGPVTFTINGSGNGSTARGGFFGPVRRAFARWERTIDRGIEAYIRGLDVVLRHPIVTIVVAFGLLGLTIAFMWPILRREFFPEVDAGSFEMYVRAP